MITKIEIGLALKKFRKHLGLTQIEFADILNSYGFEITSSSICRYEKGQEEPRVTFFLALMDLYRKEIEEIIPININERAISSIDRATAAYNKNAAVGLTETWQNRRKINMVYANNRRAAFTTKSYRKRILPLHESLIPLFSSGKTGVVFVKNGKKFNPKTTTKNFGVMLERLKIDSGAGIHTCRHTFASHLIMAGVSMRCVADYLGHSTAQITELYSHLSPEHLNNEINKLGF